MLREFACNDKSDKSQQPNVAFEERFFANSLHGNGGHVHSAVLDYSAALVSKIFACDHPIEQCMVGENVKVPKDAVARFLSRRVVMPPATRMLSILQ